MVAGLRGVNTGHFCQGAWVDGIVAAPSDTAITVRGKVKLRTVLK